MENKKFEAVLPIITAALTNEIIKKYGINESDALNKLYASEVYKLLEDESTKLWQYSTEMLLELFEREQSGNLILPEV